MSWHRKRIKLVAYTIGALTTAVLAVSTSPAAASGTYSGRAYVWGNSTLFWEDWENEGILQRDTHAYSNATCLWQRILWADGKLTSTTAIDGIFGNGTYNATRAWQQAENDEWEGLVHIAVDGSVGKETFTRAGFNLEATGGSSDPGQTLYLRYAGKSYNFNLRRLADGNYEFVDGDGAWRKAGYNYRTCS
ncbi:peptidoglycan-binding domain-containing protein [Streptomyces sp. NPDC002668]|uniref:peptidoglycan-binding domain-containing protein n=1 Tax=Streptomyces sp. NPDC002668 TaxID=3154422 RepID=UPI00331B09B7